MLDLSQWYLALVSLWWIWIGLREGRKVATAPKLPLASPAPTPSYPSLLTPYASRITSPASPPLSSPLVSVIIPARNEARKIGACIQSVVEQDYPALELVVVDDGSTDATGAILAHWASRDRRITRVAGQPVPPGWTGKNYAVWQGYRPAKGEWLLLLDADVRLAPECLRLALEYVRSQNLDLLSLAAYQETKSFAERLVQPWIFALLDFQLPSWVEAADPLGRVAIANGQWILVHRRVYERLGTHAAIADQIVEDVALVHRARAAGARTAFVPAPALVRTRMYQDWSEIYTGWSKNLAQVAGGSPAGAVRLAAGILVVSVLPLVLGIAGWMRPGPRKPWRRSRAFSGIALAIAVDGMLRYRKKAAPVYALLHPLGALATADLLLVSAWRQARRQPVVWKGRTIPVDDVGQVA